MNIADQTETIAFLEAALSRDGGMVRKIATHASLVFLGTDRAFKLKRAVRFAFLDFSTPERRLRFCEAELVLNRRTAPRIYLAVRGSPARLTADLLSRRGGARRRRCRDAPLRRSQSFRQPRPAR